MNTDLAWLAGILDGEGCITTQLRGNRLSSFLRINTISVKMAEKIKEIYQALGVKFRQSVVISDKRPNRRNLIDTCVTNRDDIETILLCCLPYLTTKADEAKLMLDFIEGEIDKETLHKGLREFKRNVQFARLR